MLNRDVLMRAARAGLGAATRTIGVDRAIRGDSRFDEVWAVASSVPGWLSRENAAAFWAVFRDTRPSTVVEIGSYQGRSTVFLGLALQHIAGPTGRLVAIDPHTGDRQQLAALGSPDALPSLDLFYLHTSGAGIDAVLDTRVEASHDVALGWPDRQAVDLVYVDGWHSYEVVRQDVHDWAPKLSASGLICFDDYGTYPEVKKAVDEGCRLNNLHVYGLILGQAWAGRDRNPPLGLREPFRWMGRRPATSAPVRPQRAIS